MASERLNESCELKLHPQRHITANATEEVKLDGYRALAVKSEGKLNLFSRRRNSFNTQYKLVFEALADLPDNTLIDGEVVALNGSGRPDFNLLQHFRTKASHIHYFVFDLLIYQNRDLTGRPLIDRRQIMRSVLKFSSPPVRLVDYFEATADEMTQAARDQGLEGVIAKRRDSRYGQLFVRSDALTRHLSAPLVDQRRQYLTHRAVQGMTKPTLEAKARLLVSIADGARRAGDWNIWGHIDLGLIRRERIRGIPQ